MDKIGFIRYTLFDASLNFCEELIITGNLHHFNGGV